MPLPSRPSRSSSDLERGATSGSAPPQPMTRRFRVERLPRPRDAARMGERPISLHVPVSGSRRVGSCGKCILSDALRTQRRMRAGMAQPLRGSSEVSAAGMWFVNVEAVPQP